MSQLKPGTEARFTVIRDGREQALSVKLDELPSTSASRDERGGGQGNSGAGLSVQPLTPEAAARLGVEAGEGIVVEQVDPSGPAAKAGFRPGDVITEVDGVTVANAKALREALADAGDRPALVLVRRDGANLFLTLSLA